MLLSSVSSSSMGVVVAEDGVEDGVEDVIETMLFEELLLLLHPPTASASAALPAER